MRILTCLTLRQFSFIYQHIFIYRIVMNILYFGQYRKRFDHIIKNLKGLNPNARVLELCFGDIYIAEWCKRMNFSWQGIDLNRKFVQFAKGLGHSAQQGDLIIMNELPSADVCIMAGSFYHFHPANTFAVLKKMLDAANHVIISEPIENLSSKSGLIGFLAKRAAGVSKRNEEFRFDLTSLLSVLTKYSTPLHFKVVSVESIRKDSIVILEKHEDYRNKRSYSSI